MQRFRLQLCQCGSRLQPFLQEQLHCGASRQLHVLTASALQQPGGSACLPAAASSSQAPCRTFVGASSGALVHGAAAQAAQPTIAQLQPSSQLQQAFQQQYIQRQLFWTTGLSASPNGNEGVPSWPMQRREQVSKPEPGTPEAYAFEREQQAAQKRQHMQRLHMLNGGEAELGRSRTLGGQSREQPQAYFRASFPIQIRNLGRRTLRTDLAAFLQRLNVDESDIRVEYDQQLLPVAWWVDLKTEDDRNIALSYHRSFLGPRRAYITGETAKSMRVAILSPLAMGSRGRYCLMTGIQNSATLEDIVRFFKGFDIMGNSVTIVKEQVYDSKHPTSSQQRSQDKRSQEKIASALGVPDEPDHRAVIRFETTEEAHRAVRTKHGSHLLNKSVRLRVLP